MGYIGNIAVHRIRRFVIGARSGIQKCTISEIALLPLLNVLEILESFRCL